MTKPLEAPWLLPLLAVSLLCACSNTEVGGIQGSITIHTANVTVPQNGVPSPLTRSIIFLGDGSLFLADVDENGNVTFEDSRIRGRVDVTAVTQSTTGGVNVFTVLDVRTPELDLDPGIPGNPPDAGVQLQGMVAGFDPGNDVSVLIVSERASGSADAMPDGTYSIDVLGEFGSQADIFVEERDPSGDLVRAGMERDMALDAASLTVDLVLSHVPSASVTATLTGQAPYIGGGAASASLYLQKHGVVLTRMTCTPDAGVATCPSLEPTGPFADVLRTVEVRVGEQVEFPNGEATATVVVPNTDSTTTVELPTPGTLVEPTLGTVGIPSVHPLSDVEFVWEVNNAPSTVLTRLSKQNAAANDLATWTIIAPPARTEFVPFTLPPGAADTASLAPGVYTTSMFWSWDRDITSISDAFQSQPTSSEAGITQWHIQLRGEMELQ